MIREFSKRSLATLLDELHSLDHQTNDPLQKMSGSLKIIKTAITRLQQIVLEQGFSSREEEVNFFKHIKTDFYAQQIFVVERYTLERNMPLRDAEAQRIFLLGEVAYVERFFLSHPFVFEYFRIGATELDELYFLRESEGSGLIFPEGLERDRSFSSPVDYLFSKFKAYGMVRDWIMERLDYLERNPAVAYVSGAESVELKWTGDSVNLAELGYALALSGQLNHGQAAIAQVFRWMEEKFVVSIGVPARRMASIRSRKRLSRTKFLDELKEVLERKMDEDDGR
ncbi:RteC domain-containing protein [Pedobacter jeongneungensis]|uniref:RteC domain-containing protein n=1 Tax=Pedobacter jeongneungensis TaxID=947309 RepID=A0ABP8BQ13_9SPHI